jgi:hypothetical protein
MEGGLEQEWGGRKTQGARWAGILRTGGPRGRSMATNNLKHQFFKLQPRLLSLFLVLWLKVLNHLSFPRGDPASGFRDIAP